MPDEPYAGGTFSFNSGGGRLRNAARSFMGGSAKASLKFDIPGLQEFQRQIDAITSSLSRLRAEFSRLAQAPQGFASQIGAMNQKMGGTTGTPAGTFGVPPNYIQVPGVSPTPQGQAPPAAPTSPGTASAAGGLPALTAASIGEAITKGMAAIGNRFDQGAAVAAQMDVYGSRTALYTGVNAGEAYRKLGRTGQPFFGTAQDVQQTIYQQGTYGNVLGGQGIAGQRGQAAATSIQGLQYLMPGMTPQQAGGIVSSVQQNVSGMRQGQVLFGAAASVYGAGGKMKTMPEYFKGILQTIMRNRTGDKANKPFTKEELEAIRIPGSNIYSWLGTLNLDQDTINAFFDWAIGQAQFDQSLSQTFNPTDKSMKQIRGPSLATANQQTQETQATRDTGFAGSQYGAMLTQQKRDQQMIDFLHSIDDTLKNIYHVAGQAPTGGLAKLANMIPGGAIAGSIFSTIGGLFGDPVNDGTSQLNPDLKKRVQAMQAANPQVGVVSGYRTSMQQKRMYESGNPNIAKPGKSQHTRGNAADLGPPSQYGWIKANARKFGLDHAARFGEPWHVQTAGTISGVGDPADDQAAAQAAQKSFAASAFASYVSGLSTPSSSGSGSGTDTTNPSGGSGVPSGSGTADIPAKGSKADLATVGQALYNAGFRGEDLIDMMAIPARETGGTWDPTSTNLKESTKDQSYGLWQINVRKDANYQTAKDFLGSEDWTQLYNVDKSAQLAYIMYQRNGNTLNPWGAYKGVSNIAGVPQSALDDARTEAQQLWPGGFGDPMAGGTGGYTGPNTTVSSTPVVFQNTFHVTAAAGTDTEALARNLSGKLETQFRRAAGMRR